MEAALAAGIKRVVHVSSTAVYGIPDHDWAKDGRGFPMIGNGRNRHQLCDVEDVCQGIRLCATPPADRVDDVFDLVPLSELRSGEARPT